jgi:gamma-glutamyl:cysteine ligase YbdK (ATP-grasp superfamily)
MGRDVPAMTVTWQDRRAYREKVRQCLEIFGRMLREFTFDAEPCQVGLEMEVNLVDALGMPTMMSTTVLAAIADPSWASELGRFNLEINVPPRRLSADALSTLEDWIARKLQHGADRASQTGSRVVLVGILPTLRQSDVTDEAMSANPRFRLLNEQMIAARGEEMRICIDGPERLLTHVDSIMPEAACTSVQCHLQVAPETFASYWNAAQAVAGVQVALAANSPYLFGRELWRETRIPLFEQVTDTRPEELKQQGVRPRVWFGERWISSVFDLFEENLRYFPALLPLRDHEDPAAAFDSGEAPRLSEMTLHNGTVYRWNRPVYAVEDGRPHLRVENRVLPAGPTVVDVLANAAFYYGLVRALAESERPVWSQMSFAAAGENLVQGAKHGIDARVYWPGLGKIPVTELVLRRLLPLAWEGLRQCRLSSADVDRLLGIVEQRCLTGRTGATWQVETVHKLQRSKDDRRGALRRMTQGYIERMATNQPVHEWPQL